MTGAWWSDEQWTPTRLAGAAADAVVPLLRVLSRDGVPGLGNGAVGEFDLDASFGPPRVSVGGSFAASVVGNTSPGPLGVADVDLAGATRDGPPTRLPGAAADTTVLAVLGWSSNVELVVVAVRGDEPYVARLGLDGTSTDLASLDVEPVGSGFGDWGSLQLATELLGAPTVEAVAPPTPADPRWIAGLGGLGGVVVLAGFVSVSLARRRRRVRR